MATTRSSSTSSKPAPKKPRARSLSRAKKPPMPLNLAVPVMKLVVLMYGFLAVSTMGEYVACYTRPYFLPQERLSVLPSCGESRNHSYIVVSAVGTGLLAWIAKSAAEQKIK